MKSCQKQSTIFFYLASGKSGKAAWTTLTLAMKNRGLKLHGYLVSFKILLLMGLKPKIIWMYQVYLKSLLEEQSLLSKQDRILMKNN